MAAITLPEIFEFENKFYETYYDPENLILSTSPELVFINAICNGDIDGAVDLFDEDQQFGNVKSSVDAPQGRFEGKDAIRQFCANWLTYAQADASYVVPVKQTRSGGRKHGCHHSRRADQKAGHRRGRHQTGPEAGDKRRSDPGGR